jgi:cell division protein FtsQ
MRAPAIPLKLAQGLSTAGVRSRLELSPRLRRRAAIAAFVALLLASLYMLWLRDSSLVAVRQVAVTGVTSRDGERVRAALTSTARTMTTLHLDQGKLEQTASVFPVVEAITLSRDFPHGLTIHVIEHRPAAMLETEGRSVPVAGDGTILSGLPVQGDLPTIELSGPAPRRELAPGAARDAAAVAGAAPAVIKRRLESIGREGGTRGVVAQVEDGPEIVFGRPDRAATKWAAAVRVLADEDSAGATYVDVRLPERPVAGGLPVETVAPVAPVGGTAGEPVIPAPDPAAAAPVEPSDDPTTAAPETVVPAPAPEPVTPAPTPAPEGTGGLVP